MKKALLSVLVLSVSMSSFATEIYFSKERMNRFACQVALSIKGAYPNKSLRNFRKEILGILRRDINPYVDAHPIPAGFSLPDFVSRATGIPGFPMDRSEYWLQNAFILFGNPEMELRNPTQNYFASFIHLARLRHVNYLNGETPRFQLRTEADLLQQIENHLPVVANFTFPYRDSNGAPVMQRKPGVKEKDLYKLVIGNPKHRQFDKFVYESQKANHFSSPLFVWMLKQKDYSVTPEKLFEKAVEIYGDPMVAMGVIPWIFSGDALTVDRGTSSVVSHKMERLVSGGDIPGYQYHFWGYLTQAFIGNRLRVGALAYIYEKLYQKDLEDWTVDALSLKTGQKIRTSFKKPELCR